MTSGVSILLGVLALTAVVGVLFARRNGRVSHSGAPEPSAVGLTAEDLGAPLGERATVVQFSTAFCAPCRAARVSLRHLAEKSRGVAYIDIDAESHLELVRRLNVVRTPTVLVLDAHGRIAGRGSGDIRVPDVVASLGTVL